MRSDCILDKIRDRATELLFSTSLSYSDIGSVLGCSRGPVYKIYKECKANGRVRPNIRIKHLRTCRVCGKEAIIKTQRTRPNRGKFCSKECYAKWLSRDENRGPNNPNWIDGGKHEDEMNRLRHTEKWRIWREAVYQRDDYTCQLCGEKGLELHPHHVLQKCDYPDLIFEVDNGIALCKDCHRSKGVHSYKGIFIGLFRMLIEKNSEAALMHR